MGDSVSGQDGTYSVGVIPVRNIYLRVKLIHPRSSKDPPRHILDTGQPDTVIPNSYVKSWTQLSKLEESWDRRDISICVYFLLLQFTDANMC